MSSAAVDAKEWTNCSTCSLPGTAKWNHKWHSALRWKFSGADAMIITNDGSKVGVNRRRLAAQSPFFNAVFFGGFSESPKRAVRLPSISYDRLYEALYVMEKLDILGSDFVFNISLTKTLQIYETANFLAIDKVSEWLADLAIKLMVPEELINTFRRVEYRCPPFASRLHTLIVHNFDRIYYNQTFLMLKEAELVGFLKNHRLNLTPKQEKTMVEEFLVYHPEEENQVLQAMRQETLKRTDEWGYLGRPRTPNKVLITFGGWSTGGPSAAVEAFDIVACLTRPAPTTPLSASTAPSSPSAASTASTTSPPCAGSTLTR
ncbi:hypothetical protein L596_027323 [Steinernema carpocapsae]|uniref:BTB domain-containing protein n=1 Tax=Steinernema carpocapsae TaxID=34508 RepID=A0A4U5M3Z6_STECR|nr:hypothetical protein L596_027323 [Steinernema carpocapsae]